MARCCLLWKNDWKLRLWLKRLVDLASWKPIRQFRTAVYFIRQMLVDKIVNGLELKMQWRKNEIRTGILDTIISVKESTRGRESTWGRGSHLDGGTYVVGRRSSRNS